MVVKCILLALFIGLVRAQSEISIPDNFTLPPELQGKFDQDQLKGFSNQSLSALKKKCDENGGPTAFDDTQAAQAEFQRCIASLVDMNQLNEEIKEASPNGQVDEVFKKYCAKTPIFETCFKNMTESLKPCLSDKERENMKTVSHVAEQLAEFVCYKEGDRIALFIAEGGQECFQEKQLELQSCANKTLGSNLPVEDGTGFSFNNVPNIAFGETECKQLTELQVCVVGVLEKCQKPTTGNIVDSLFKFIRKATPCNDKVEVKSVPGSAPGLAVMSTTVLLGLSTMLLI